MAIWFSCLDLSTKLYWPWRNELPMVPTMPGQPSNPYACDSFNSRLIFRLCVFRRSVLDAVPSLFPRIQRVPAKRRKGCTRSCWRLHAWWGRSLVSPTDKHCARMASSTTAAHHKSLEGAQCTTLCYWSVVMLIMLHHIGGICFSYLVPDNRGAVYTDFSLYKHSPKSCISACTSRLLSILRILE